MKMINAVASAFLLFLAVSAAHAADTATPGGAALSTPGTENKANPIAVPDRATENTRETVPPAGAVLGTPGEENKETRLPCRIRTTDCLSQENQGKREERA